MIATNKVRNCVLRPPVKNAKAPAFRLAWGPSDGARERVAQFRKEQAGLPRATAAQRGYDRDWFRLRAVVLREEPFCRHCAAVDVQTRATVLDHIESIRDAPERRLDRDNLQPLCQACHNRKTTRVDGGFGKARAGRPALCDALRDHNTTPYRAPQPVAVGVRTVLQNES
jgi:5-methylcytosine-specific restriction protein A